MVQGDVLHDGQTQTRATHFAASRAVNTVETLEQSLLMFWRNAWAFVLDLQLDLSMGQAVRRQRDRGAFRGVTQGILIQIAESLFDQANFHLDHEILVDINVGLHVTRRSQIFVQGLHSGEHGIGINMLQTLWIDFGRVLQLRELQEVGDDVADAFGVAVDHLDAVPLGVFVKTFF